MSGGEGVPLILPLGFKRGHSLLEENVPFIRSPLRVSRRKLRSAARAADSPYLRKSRRQNDTTSCAGFDVVVMRSTYSTGYEKGERGCPGELFGTFVSGLASGSIIVNCEQGVFGKMTYSSRADAIPIAFKSEVKQGKAKILTTISGNKPEEFDIEIEKLTISSACKTKNIVIKVTDPRLLSATGGIVQGMSGSPIIQDGKLVGAVTHVFVSDPTRGYGIFIENMMEAAEGAADKAA